MDGVLLALVVITLLFLVSLGLVAIEGGAGRPGDSAGRKGDAGEQTLYRTLVNEVGVPSEYILRNVYIPVGNGRTTELDIVAVTKKGVFVFECKNYGGNVYGDAKKDRWVQYLGDKKSYFYSPLLQNREHCRHLKRYISFFGSIPVISMVSVTSRGRWKVRNLGEKDYLLGYNCHFVDVYNSMDDSVVTALNRNNIIKQLKKLENPSDDVKQKHINNTKMRR